MVVDNTPRGVGSSSAIEGTVGVAESGEPHVPGAVPSLLDSLSLWASLATFESMRLLG